MKTMETIAVYSNKHSEKCVKFIELSIKELSKYCSKRYADRIIKEQNNGNLYGVYFTESGRIKATFI